MWYKHTCSSFPCSKRSMTAKASFKDSTRGRVWEVLGGGGGGGGLSSSQRLNQKGQNTWRHSRFYVCITTHIQFTAATMDKGDLFLTRPSNFGVIDLIHTQTSLFVAG